MKKRPAVIKSVLSSIVENGYDSMGRRYMQKVTINGTVTRHERYLYRGYLQIAALDILHGGKQKHALFWDPTEPLATRPLVLLSSDDNRYTYAHDLTKNVTELLDAEGNIAAAYDYDPFGKVTAAGHAAHLNPIQWSSEIYDPELALVYYNYRHYNPTDGRWINRDPIAEQGGMNLYEFVGNYIMSAIDLLETSCLSPENFASCIGINSYAKVKKAFGAGWKLIRWRQGKQLLVDYHSFSVRIHLYKKNRNTYAKDSPCSCGTVFAFYLEKEYPYAVYASAAIVTNEDINPTIYQKVSGLEQITVYGKFQADEIRMSESLSGNDKIGKLNIGINEFTIDGRFLKRYKQVRVQAYVENPNKSPITIHDQIYAYMHYPYLQKPDSYKWSSTLNLLEIKRY